MRALAALAACAVAFVGMLLPWVNSGAVTRSSFQLLGLIDRLGFAPQGPIRLVIKWWPLAPVLLTLTVVLLFWGMPRLGATIGLIASIYVGAFAAVIRFGVPANTGIAIGNGPALACVASAVLLVVCLWSLARRRINPHPTLAQGIS